VSQSIRLFPRRLRSIRHGRRQQAHQRVSHELRQVQRLEDRSLLAQVSFLNMIAEVTAISDDGESIGEFLRGSATVNIADTPGQTSDGRDFVNTEIVSLDLQGFDSFNGPLTVRVSSLSPSTGMTSERQNVVPGQIDTGLNVDSFFDLVLEIDAIVDHPTIPDEEIQAILHGAARIATGAAGASGVPVAPGDTMTLVQPFDLFLDAGRTMPAGFEVEDLDITFTADFSSISGQKWHDLNGDGVQDAGEPGLDNWIIVAIDLETDVPIEADATRSEDLDGSGGIDPDTEQGLFTFNNLPPGRYFITEMQQSGWSQTFPAQVPAGDLPHFGPGSNWLRDARAGNEFLDVGMLATFDFGQGEEVVFLQGSPSIFAGSYDGDTDSVTVEVGRFDLRGNSSRGPVHLVTGDPNANNVNEGPLHLSGQFVQDPSDPFQADSIFDISFELDFGNPVNQAPDPSTVLKNTTPVRVESKGDRLSPLGLPYQMTNASPVPFFDSGNVQQAQLVDLRFTTFREELFDQTVGYIYEIGQGQQIDNVLFGNRDLASGPFGVDYGDADAPYPTLAAENGASHSIDGKHFLGDRVDAEQDGQPNPLALGDDLNNPQFSTTSDDEDGVLFPQPLVSGFSSTLMVFGSPFATAAMRLNAWIDFKGNGSWADDGDQIFTNRFINPGQNSLSVNVPLGLSDGAFTARFRVNTAGGLSFDGAAADGEVEDYLVTITAGTPLATDFGDAPDPVDSTAGQYPTLLVNNGARHAIDGVTVLGSFIDGETDGQPTANADGDDSTGLVDDEDGITVTEPLNATLGGAFEISTLSGGFLNAWVDFNADGDWDDARERIATDFGLAAGANTLFVSVPEIADGGVVGPTFARFRLSPQPGEVTAPTGPAVDSGGAPLGFGEVEDIAITIYQGELFAEADLFELSLKPQQLPLPADEVDDGRQIGLIFSGTNRFPDRPPVS
jgi:hypothetical protein